MSRRRPDHSAEMGDRERLRSRRRRRRLGRALVRGTFWMLVLAGVFVLGLGYGRTIAGDDEQRRDEVTVEQELGTIEATLPTRTETVVKTVTAPAPKTRRSGTARTPARP